MAENEPPALPPGRPGSPGADDPTPPRGLARPGLEPAMDAEEYRRFQEFQRFQDYQRFVEAQQQNGGNLPVPMPGAPNQQQQGQMLETQLDGMRQQLARIERVTNPPLWQKILRNKWLHRAIWLVVVIILATWGIPKLVHHYLGGGNDDVNPSAPANLPLPIGQSGELADGPHEAVFDVYLFIAQDSPRLLCNAELGDTATTQFAQVHHATSCAAAVAQLHSALTPDQTDAYLNLSLTQLPTPPGDTEVITSCQLTQMNQPALGTFTVTKQEKGWQVTDYQAPAQQCSATPSGSTPPS